ncbi:MAG TPA: tetratricopeptide repeat protein [Myxococcota bacterium]|nr:tetratricopeptide repeat protein [Myxococcota bacterium]
MRAALVCSIVLLLAFAGGCKSREARILQQRQTAKEYYDKKEWSEAKIALLNLLKLAPNDGEAHYQMAETLWNLQEYGESLWQYKEASRLQPENESWKLKLAQILFVARDYDASLENTTQLLEKDPKNIDALLLRGGLKSVKGDVDGLLEDVDAALAINPQHEAALALKAQALGRKGDVAGAEDALRKLVEAKGSAANHASLARFLAITGKNDEALKELQTAVQVAETPEERTAVRLFLTNFYVNQGKNDEAEKVLLQARDDSPTDSNVLLTLARFYYSAGKADKAEEMLEEGVKAKPKEVDPLLVLADYHRRTGAMDKALADVDRAIALDPSNEAAKLRKAELMVDQKGELATPTTESWKIVNDVLAKNPKSVLGLFTQGKFYLLDKKYAEAATSLRRVIDEQPNASAHVLLGTAYLAQHQNELARSEFQQALQLDAQSLPARSQLAALYLDTNENESAAREAKAALEQNPGDLRVALIYVESLVRLKRNFEAREALHKIQLKDDAPADVRLKVAQLYRRTGERKVAAPILEKILEQDPNNSAAMAELAQADIDDRQPEEAMKKVDGWIEKQPDNPALYEMRAKIRLGSSEQKPDTFELAEADLKKAIEKDPKRVETMMTLGKLYREAWKKEGGEKRLDQAIQTFDQAHALQKDNPAISLELAQLCESAGRTQQAKDYYEDVLRVDQDQPAAKNNLAWLLANSENPSPTELDRALQLAQDAKNALPNNPSVADTLGWIMYKKGIPAAAIALFREAIDKYPEGHPLRGTVRYHLAKAYDRNGERDRAVSELKRALDEVSNFSERADAEKFLKELQTG